MSKEVIFLSPVFKQMIWGGNRMRTEYGYNIPGDDTGECWAISAHRNGDCTVRGGSYDGMLLSELWEQHQELFGNAAEGLKRAGSGFPVFPLLTKIIDARENLSIQVHPDDSYAGVHENGSLGKTECWYILDCDPGASIIIGHNARNKQELEDMITNGRWSEFLREVPIKKGDFLQIYPGTVHAIKGGTMILETQQNSDITYRVYDYDRLQNGKPRQLHVRQSIDVITVPFTGSGARDKGTPLAGDHNESLIRCDYYCVWKLNADGEASYIQDRPFMLCSVIGGEGSIDGRELHKGDHFILPAGYGTFTIKGGIEMICSAVR